MTIALVYNYIVQTAQPPIAFPSACVAEGAAMNPYEANDSTRDTSATHSAHDDMELSTYVITHLAEALEKDWVVPYYQPVIRTLTGKLCGFEALARWEDPVHGIIPPNKFIPVLEQAQTIHLLDCHIIHQVCRRYREGVNRGEPMVPISFNLSRLDFDFCDVFTEVENAAHEHGVPRRMLNVEITESALGIDSVFMASIIHKFRETGYQVWMDDFGSGYSTLNALKDFDFDELKIDMEFLNRFGEKSRTILASVVDMAKRLGIQTLAEGVENEEHRNYLSRIGCEKMQGYLFGKPMPYDPETYRELVETLGVETTSERLYMNEIGAVNTLSLSERDLTAGNSTQGYVTSMPLALVEYHDGRFTIHNSNRVFREGLANVGINSIEEAERRINNPLRPLARQAQRLIETIETDKFARIDYVAGDIACLMRAKHIASRDGKIALLVSIDDTIEQGERKRRERMDNVLGVMYTIYDHVSLIHLDEHYIQPVFDNIGLHMQFDEPDLGKVAAAFAESEVFARDRRRFLEFMNPNTVFGRIAAEGSCYTSDFFRLRQHGGDYDWKLFLLIHLTDQPGNQLLLCIRPTNASHEGLFQVVYDNDDKASRNLMSADLDITDGSLWRTMVRYSHLNLFWKDRERRFVGASQPFLDFYGFSSVADILGKTDEDMGWHINPTPFMEDEQRILNEGAQVNDAIGTCIVNGEVHNIVANKRPIYRNGHIVGILGYFFDADAPQPLENAEPVLATRDAVSGVLNYIGLEAATWQYVDSYKRQGIDFAMVSVNVESFDTINEQFGYEFGEKVLRRIGDELTDIAQHRHVVGHVHSERFVVLVQNLSDEELKDFCRGIERRLSSIAQVDGTSCTIYALASFARFSDIGDVDAMKRHNRDYRLKRREEMGIAKHDDVITTSLL